MKINRKKIVRSVEKAKQWYQKQKTMKALRQEERIAGHHERIEKMEEDLKWREREASLKAREQKLRRPQGGGGSFLGANFSAAGERMQAIDRAMNFDFVGPAASRRPGKKNSKKQRRRQRGGMFDFSDVL